jgi:hypothetical protein
VDFFGVVAVLWSYERNILGPVAYYWYMYQHIGLTDSKYPRLLALGWCSHGEKEIVVCKVGNWQLRLMQEIGPEIGIKHIMREGFVMHPWGHKRGKGLL